MNPVPHFSETYAAAGERFLAAAKEHGLYLDRHVHPTARGASDEDLSIDIAELGDASGQALAASLTAESRLGNSRT